MTTNSTSKRRIRAFADREGIPYSEARTRLSDPSWSPRAATARLELGDRMGDETGPVAHVEGPAIATIHRRARPDLSTPYPFQIDAVGAVLDQDFWQGDPVELIGFRRDPEPGALDLNLSGFAADPDSAVGMWCVMRDSAGNFYMGDPAVIYVAPVPAG